MKIKVNGKNKLLEIGKEEISLSKILKLLGYKPNTIVVELNNTIINFQFWDSKFVHDGDKIEIVSIVGGG